MNIFDAVKSGNVLDVALALRVDNVNAVDVHGCTPIFYAMDKDIQILELLLDAGADTKHISHAGSTCIGFLLDNELSRDLRRFELIFNSGIKLTYMDKVVLRRFATHAPKLDHAQNEGICALFLKQNVFSISGAKGIEAFSYVYPSESMRELVDTELAKPERHARDLFEEWLLELNTSKITVMERLYSVALLVSSPQRDVSIRDHSEGMLYLEVHTTLWWKEALEKHRKLVLPFRTPDVYTDETIQYLVDLIYEQTKYDEKLVGCTKCETQA